jgi:hypothetical protein
MYLPSFVTLENRVRELGVSADVLVPLVSEDRGHQLHLVDPHASGRAECGNTTGDLLPAALPLSTLPALSTILCSTCSLSYTTPAHGAFGELVDAYNGVKDLLVLSVPGRDGAFLGPVRAIDAARRALTAAAELEKRTGLFGLAARARAAEVRADYEGLLDLLRSPAGLEAFLASNEVAKGQEPLEDPLVVLLAPTGLNPVTRYVREVFGVLDVTGSVAALVPAPLAAAVRQRVSTAHSTRQGLRASVATPELVRRLDLGLSPAPEAVLETALTLWDPDGSGEFPTADAALEAACAL